MWSSGDYIGSGKRRRLDVATFPTFTFREIPGFLPKAEVYVIKLSSHRTVSSPSHSLARWHPEAFPGELQRGCHLLNTSVMWVTIIGFSKLGVKGGGDASGIPFFSDSLAPQCRKAFLETWW